MLLALLLITAPASLQIDGADPALHERLHRMLLPLWRRSLDAQRVAALGALRGGRRALRLALR